jgi:hypothetical protein
VIDDFFEIKDHTAGPNPYNGQGDLRVYFSSTRQCSAVTFKLYTNSFRLIRKFDLGSADSGPASRAIAQWNLNKLANGTYFYIITGEGLEGTVRSRAEKLLIVK